MTKNQHPQNPLEQMATYVLEFLLGNEQRSVIICAADAANGVILEETSEDSGIMRGLLLGGGKVEIPFPNILKVEEYKVTANWGGNGCKTRKMTGEQIADYTSNCGGEAKSIRRVEDSKGNTVYDSDDGKDKRLNR